MSKKAEMPAHSKDHMARKKEETLEHFLKDMLQTEEKNSALNLQKVNEGWRSLLCQTDTAELRNDVTVLKQMFDRQVDDLDSVIKHLVSDLREVEQQRAQARQCHLQQLDRLLVQHNRYLTFLQQQWESGMQHLSKNISSERQETIAVIQEQQTDLQDQMFLLEHQLHTKQTEDKRLYNQEEELLNKFHFNLMSGQTIQHGSKKDKLLQDQEAQSSSEEMNVQTLAEEDKVLLQEMEAKNKAGGRNYRSAAVNELQSKLHSCQNQYELDSQNLKAARDEETQKNQELRAQIKRCQTKARKQLAELSIQGNSTTNKLKAVIAKGEKILRLDEICRKLERDQELFFSASMFCAPPKHEKKLQSQPPMEELLQELGPGLELTWLRQRLSAALLQQQAVKMHKEHLKRENLQLQDLLRQRLGAMAVSTEALHAGQPSRSVQAASAELLTCVSVNVPSPGNL
ncbi:dynein regulatory complex subunit 2 [Thalassophryne amazonica]|uniref:dynein regulatory complex subunit 2 n=1 Tax=Thalassophryne amazonica TaxID=390379 RepID=UPI001470E3FA|nr:dynein regulatory complex subunit 2 [Thalassophryne amazonica]